MKCCSRCGRHTPAEKELRKLLIGAAELLAADARPAASLWRIRARKLLGETLPLPMPTPRARRNGHFRSPPVAPARVPMWGEPGTGKTFRFHNLPRPGEMPGSVMPPPAAPALTPKEERFRHTSDYLRGLRKAAKQSEPWPEKPEKIGVTKK